MIKHSVVPGVILGALLGAWVFTMGFTGWYKHPQLLNLFWVVVLIQAVVLTVTLRGSAGDGAGYGKRVLHGAGTSFVAGLIVIGNSLLFTTVAFPKYFEELRAMQEKMLREAGRSDAEIKALIDQVAAVQTPAMQAMFGFMGTVVTGVVLSLIIAAVVRGKKKEG